MRISVVELSVDNEMALMHEKDKNVHEVTLAHDNNKNAHGIS